MRVSATLENYAHVPRMGKRRINRASHIPGNFSRYREQRELMGGGSRAEARIGASSQVTAEHRPFARADIMVLAFEMSLLQTSAHVQNPAVNSPPESSSSRV